MSEESAAQIRISINALPYYVYALIDPRDDTMRYIGMTRNVCSWLIQHTKDVSKSTSKGAWLNELAQLGLSPELEVLETIPGSKDSSVMASQRERHWIKELLRQGIPLVNIQIPSSTQEVASLQTSSLRRLADRVVTKFEELRTNAEITIAQLSREANISTATLRKIEKDQPVRAALAARACNALSHHLGYQVTYKELAIKAFR